MEILQTIFIVFLFLLFAAAKYAAIQREKRQTRHNAGIKAWRTTNRRYRIIPIKQGDKVINKLIVKI